MSDADQLKAYLAERDVPCPGCGYNLRGVAEPVCPECGIELSIESIEAEIDRKKRRLHRHAAMTLFVLNLIVQGLGTLYAGVGLGLRLLVSLDELTSGDTPIVVAMLVKVAVHVVLLAVLAIWSLPRLRRSVEWMIVINPLTIFCFHFLTWWILIRLR